MFRSTFNYAYRNIVQTKYITILKMTINTDINVSDYRLFVEPIEFFQFFVLWPCFQLPHIFGSPVKISLKQKRGKGTQCVR